MADKVMNTDSKIMQAIDRASNAKHFEIKKNSGMVHTVNYFGLHYPT